MIQKLTVLFAVFFAVSVMTLSAQQGGGFTGPGRDSNRRVQAEVVTVADAKNLADDTRIILRGTIVNSLGDEEYLFRDESGEIIVEIDRKVWQGLSVGENDRVEIYGEVDADRRGAEIDVKTIRKM